MRFLTGPVGKLISPLVVCAVFFLHPAHAVDLDIMTGEWKPFVSAGLDNHGFTAEIITRSFRAAGIQPRFHFAPWPRCEAGVKYGKTFGAFPYSRNESREAFALFSNPLARARTVFFYNPGKLKSFDYTDLNQLKNLLVGGVRGYYYEPRFTRADLPVDYSENEDDAFKKLFYNRVDVVPLDELVGWEIVRRLFPGRADMFATSRTALDESELRLMVSKKHPGADELLERFNEGLETIMANGVYESILEKYQIPKTAGALPEE